MARDSLAVILTIWLISEDNQLVTECPYMNEQQK
jgi:hypothetical protein